MKKQYNVVVTERKSVARSKRLRESGQSSSGTVISVLGGNSGGSGNAGDGHTHENLLTLNRIKTDKEDYLTLRTSELDEETGVVTTSDKRSKVGYADEAGHAVNADNATHADNAIHADKAHDVDDDSPVYDKVLRKDRSDRTDHSLDIGGDLIVGGFENVLGGLEVKGGFSVDTADASGDITGCNLKAVETISGTDVTVLETISGKNITATETVSAQNVDATGTISANMIDTTETISGKNILASEGVAGENVTASNSVSGKNVTAKETVSGKNVTVSGKVTTLNLLVQSLANTYDLNVSHVATLFQTVVKDYISSELYTPGLTGSGMKLYKAVSGDWNLELDNVTVRKAMTIFELIISKIRAVNGGLVISPANGKVKSVLLTNDIYRLEIEGDMMFVADDLVRCQTFTKTGTKYYWVRITSVSGQYILINKTEFAKSVPAVGDELVQFGNKTDVARQGILYLTASEDGKPRFSVLDGVNSTDLTGKTKVILGCLDGITDTDFLTDFQPSGYGLYSENVFLKGSFVLKSGKKIEEFINDGIASVQVGGRNLLANSDFSENSLSKWRGSQDNNYTLSIENSELKIVGQQGRTSAELNNSWNTAWYVAPYSFNVAGDYTISFDAYALKACTLYFRANYFTHPTYGGSVQIGTKKQRYSVVFKNDTNENSRLLGFAFSVATTLYLDNVKLELGNKATDWTPAPEDVNTRITNIETQFEIREGVISTKVTEATTAATNAKKSETSASTSASTATTKATAAASSATSASTSATTATTKATAASSSATAASGSATTAGQKATAAANSATAAAASATNAQKAAESAETILEEVTTKESSITQTAGQIATKVTEVNKKVTEATTAATTATTKANAASSSATAAAGSATTATTKATAAANSATAAAGSATNAKSSADSAAAKLTTITEKESSINQTAGEISTKVTEVTKKATEAATSASTATTKANAAASSATTAGTKATAAANSATAAASSATNAKNSADTATAKLATITEKESSINQTASSITTKVTEVNTKASQAATSATNAANSATAASGSATTATTKATAAANSAELALAMSKGKMIYRDPSFKSGSNSCSVYNNSGNGNVTVTRVSGVAGNPNSSGYCLKVKTTGTASPGWGGFHWGATAKANRVLVVRLIANIPTGYTLNFATNSLGTGASQKWLTAYAGTGKWTEYAYKIVCGASGTFSSTGYFYLSGGNTPTAATPLEWHICYATIFDVTDAEIDYISDAAAKYTTKTEHTSSITQLSNSIELKVAKTDFNALGTRVSSAETTIKQHTGQIALKAAKTDVTALGTRMSAAEAKITPDAIKLTVKSQTETIAGNAANAVQVGGRNLLTGSDFKTLNSSYYYSGNANTYTLSLDNGMLKVVGKAVGSSSLYTIVKQLFHNESEDYVFSFDAYALAETTISARFGYGTVQSGGTALIGTAKKRYSLKLKGVYNSDTYSVFLFWFDKITTVWFDNMKLEKGNKATDWTPAPEDVATDAQSKADAAKQAAITDAAGKYTTKTEHSSSITQLNNSIALKVAKTDFNALGTRVSTAETTIRQHTDQIALKAAKTDVTALGTRVSAAEAKITPDAIKLTVKSQTETIAANAAKRTELWVDATALDASKYYPITIALSTGIPMYTITVDRSLNTSYGKPSWSTHTNGFSVVCKWSTNASGWGAISVQRTILDYACGFASVTPVGSIGQMINSSCEYAYVRGGSKYRVTVEGATGVSIALRTAAYTASSQTINILTSVTTPVPDKKATDTRITNVETQFEIREGVISTKVTEATTAATNAKKSETSASTSASTATTKATAAASSATSASTSATTATTKANAASSSATAASGSATTAGQKATAAANSATAAATSATNAQKAAESAETILEEVTTKESCITQTAGQIATKVTEVNKKVTEATTAATTATTKATAAATSATNAKTSETNAGTKATAAANSATAAATSATNAKSSADTAAAKLTTITEKESSINQTASSITTKVTEVTTKATQAATSAANAKTSETNAGTKATAAANSATTAGTKATAAASSATSAAASLTSVTTKQSEINAKADQITLKVTEVTTKTTQATNAAELATAMSKGKMLYRDPTFKDGSYNGTAVYLPTGVTRSYIAVTGCPNPAAKAMKFVATQFYTATDKRIGGFLFGNKSRANAVFVVRIIANIPTGRNLNVYHNSYGTGGATKWLTSTAGAGKWQEYACKVTCGASGTFSGLNHFALTGGAAPTTAAPLTWYVAYATVFDVTDVDDTPSREEIKSGMTITAGGISIFGKELSLAGKVTFSSLDSAAQSTINGKATPAQIATAKSEAISTAATDATTKANNAKSSAISTAATDATTKANNAKTAAISAAATDATTKANNALTNARNDVAVKLGYASYTEMVNQATAKNTIINGGYIRTSLIDADTLITGSLLATKIAATEITTGKLTVTTGAKIGGWNVEGNSLSIKSAASAKILVEPSGTRFLRINDSATELLGIRADGVTGIGIYTQNVSGTCLSMIAQTGGTAVESYGSHTFGQRPGEVWNAPGVLRAARINADGGTDHVWGNGTPNFYTYKSSNGIYVITHNLGHTDYMPFVTMISDWNFLYTPEIYDNYFVVKMQSNKGSWENDSFNVMIVGRNRF
nr:MAG TPA: Minor structural protein 4 [Bacteriophage sp.]